MKPMKIFLFVFAMLTTVFAAESQADDHSTENLFKRLNALVKSDHPEVKYHLGMFYNNGIGVTKNPQLAFSYFEQTARAGDDLAAYKLGCYYAGQFAGVVGVDDELALKWKMRAAIAGYDLAQHDIAQYWRNKGDLAKAVIWWERASRQANVAATAMLADYFSKESSSEKTKGYALLLLLKERMPNVSQQLADRIAALESTLSADEKIESERIRTTWLLGPTPITLKATSGLSSVSQLLSTLEK